MNIADIYNYHCPEWGIEGIEKKCPDCLGYGKFTMYNSAWGNIGEPWDCSTCHGTGKVITPIRYVDDTEGGRIAYCPYCLQSLDSFYLHEGYTIEYDDVSKKYIDLSPESEGVFQRKMSDEFRAMRLYLLECADNDNARYVDHSLGDENESSDILAYEA